MALFLDVYPADGRVMIRSYVFDKALLFFCNVLQLVEEILGSKAQ